MAYRLLVLRLESMAARTAQSIRSATVQQPYPADQQDTGENHAGESSANRRVYRRLSAHEFQWIRTARIKYGRDVQVIDISAGGMAIETPHPLKPHSTVVFELAGEAGGLVVPARVLRCQKTTTNGAVAYRSACAFKGSLELSRLLADPPRLRKQPTDFITLDVGLKKLLDQHRDTSTADLEPTEAAACAADIVASLESLLVKASGRRGDAVAHDVAELISSVVTVLREGGPSDAVLTVLEHRLRNTTAPMLAQVADTPSSPSGMTAETIYLTVPGDDGVPRRVLNVELPQGYRRNAREVRVLQAAAHLVQVVHEWNRFVMRAEGRNEPRVEIDRSSPGAPAVPAACWQKVVVRYRDGRVMRGFTSDFNISRPQLHLSPTPFGEELLIVPLTQLKALFFVKDFAGNPAYVEDKTFADPAHGRKIEVTFDDGEVLVGTTLSYRSEGYGFFVQPADKKGNNLRVFVSSGSVRHVRFLPARQ